MHPFSFFTCSATSVLRLRIVTRVSSSNNGFVVARSGWTTGGSPASRSGRESIAATTSVPTFISNSIFHVSILFLDSIFHTTARSVERRRSTWPPRPSERPFRRASFHLCANPFVFVRFFSSGSFHLVSRTLTCSLAALATRVARDMRAKATSIRVWWRRASQPDQVRSQSHRWSSGSLQSSDSQSKGKPTRVCVGYVSRIPDQAGRCAQVTHTREYSLGVEGMGASLARIRGEARVHSLLEVEEVLHVVVTPPSPWSAPQMWETGLA